MIHIVPTFCLFLNLPAEKMTVTINTSFRTKSTKAKTTTLTAKIDIFRQRLKAAVDAKLFTVGSQTILCFAVRVANVKDLSVWCHAVCEVFGRDRDALACVRRSCILHNTLSLAYVSANISDRSPQRNSLSHDSDKINYPSINKGRTRQYLHARHSVYLPDCSDT